MADFEIQEERQDNLPSFFFFPFKHFTKSIFSHSFNITILWTFEYIDSSSTKLIN